MRLPLAGDLDEMVDAADFDPARLGGIRVEIEKSVQEDVFGRQAGHVAPHVGRDGLDFGIALFRIGEAQIVDRHPMPSDPWTNTAGDTVGEVERAVRRQKAQQADHRHGKPRHQPVLHLAQPPPVAEHEVPAGFPEQLGDHLVVGEVEVEQIFGRLTHLSTPVRRRRGSSPA